MTRKRGGNRGHSHHGGVPGGRPSAAENARNEQETQRLQRLGKKDPILDGVEDGEDPPEISES